MGLPIAEIRDLVTSPVQLKNLAQLQFSFFNFRFLLPVLLARQVGVFAALEQTPLRAQRLAEHCDIHPEAAKTLVRVLESQGILTSEARSSEDAQVALSEFAARFLTAPHKSGTHSSASLLPVIDLLLTYTLNFEQMADSLRSGHTPTSLDVRGDDPTVDAVLQAVNSHLAQASREFLMQAKLPKIRSCIVGSMGVSFSAALLHRHKNARVTYGCLDHLVRRIPSLRDQYEVDATRVDGMHAHSGDPAGDDWGDDAYDLVFLTRKMILDPRAHIGEKFARKALDVLSPGGAVVFWEAIHPDQGPSPLPLALETVFDLGMSPSAPLKTRSGFARTLREIGFGEIDYVSCLGGTTTFAVARKAN
jgi:hypothetical protein